MSRLVGERPSAVRLVPLSLLGGLFLISSAAFSPPLYSAEEDAALKRCAMRNLPTRSTSESFRMESVDRTGGRRTLAGKFFWKSLAKETSGTRVLIQEPPSLRGSSYLLLESEPSHLDMFVYLSELGSVRRITPHAAGGSFLGTDFSYEDLRHLRRIVRETSSERLADTTLEGRRVYVAQLSLALGAGSTYERIVAFLDQEACVPLTLAVYEKGARLRKVLEVDPKSLRRQGNFWTAGALVLRDLRDETLTYLWIDAMEIDPDLSDRLFTQSNLKSQGR